MKRTNFLHKLILLAVVLIAGTTSIQAQIKVGDNPTVISPSSLLEMESKTKGLVLPRMNGSEMVAISSPYDGMLVYNTDSACVCLRTAGVWRSVCNLGTDNNWALLGNNGTNPTTNFVGTKDNQGLSIRTNSADRIRIDATGKVGVNTSTPAYQLDVNSTANPVRLTGMQGGGKNDSLVSIDAIGVLRKRTVKDVLADGLDAENGVNIDGTNTIRLGGPLTQATTITLSSTNTLALPGMQGGFTTDSIVVTDGTSGILRRRTVASVVGNAFTADNGLTKNTANNVQLGGTLLQATTVATSASNTFAFSGLQHGTVADSVVLANASSGVLKRASMADLLKNTIQAENGVNIDNNNIVRLGGALTGATTVTASASNTMSFQGLQHGTIGDSIVLNDASTGVLKRARFSDLLSNTITADNGLTKTGNNIQMGGALIQATTVTTSASNTLALQGIQHGTIADSVLLNDAASGIVKRARFSDLLSNTITANNGLTKTGNNIQLGGALVQATTVTTTASNTLAVDGLQHGTIADSVVLANASTGVLRRAKFGDLLSNSITADNGLTKTGNNIQMGGALIQATTVTTTSTNTLSIPGLQHGTIADSIVLASAATGTLKRANFADLLSNTITANNGLTKTGNNIQLGGTLIQNTSVAQGAFNQTFTSTDGNFVFNPSGTGKFGIGTASPTQKLHVEGNLFVSGAMMTPSDIRLKDHITKLNYGLKEVLALSTIHYDWKDRARFGDDFRIGVVAQEVQVSMPELVRVAKDEQKSLSVSYSEFAPVFINAIKELNGKIDGLKSENDALKAEVDNLNSSSTSTQSPAAAPAHSGEKK